MNQAAKHSPRRQHLARHLHELGPRAVFLALLDVEAGRPLDDVIESFGRVHPSLSRWAGGDRFPPQPLAPVRTVGAA